MNLGKSRLTEVKSLSFPDSVEEVGDEHGQHSGGNSGLVVLIFFQVIIPAHLHLLLSRKCGTRPQPRRLLGNKPFTMSIS